MSAALCGGHIVRQSENCPTDNVDPEAVEVQAYLSGRCVRFGFRRGLLIISTRRKRRQAGQGEMRQAISRSKSGTATRSKPARGGSFSSEMTSPWRVSIQRTRQV